MNKENTSTNLDNNNQRIAHACQICREKRVRCSGMRPTCRRCQKLQLHCVYGFARGDRRRNVLAALNEHNRQGEQSVSPSQTDSASQSTSRNSDTPATTAPAGDCDDENSGSDDTEDDASSICSPRQQTRETSSNSASTPESKPSKIQHRRTRISSACLECKKRRRKCTGDVPCQTCTIFQMECIYDRNMDRRSKAFFTKQLNDGVRVAMEADNMEGVLTLLHENNQYNSVASELRTALTGKAKSLTSLATNTETVPSKLEKEKRQICTAYCGLGAFITIKAQGWSRDAQERQEALLKGPPHLMLPYVIEDDSPLSLVFSNFRDAVQHMLGQGAELSNVLGPVDPEVDLLFRARSPTDPFTAGTWACELARIYACIDIFTQLANAFLLSRFMRWVISPTIENWIMLPDIMKPTITQCMIPHFASADLYSLPVIRDSLVRGETKLSKAFGAKVANGVRMHWPFRLEQAIDRCPVTGKVKISRLFAECVSDTKYWSCSEDYLEYFPEVKEHLRVISHQHGWEHLEAI